MTEWISIKDRLPEREKSVLIIDNCLNIYLGFLSKYYNSFDCYCNCSEGSSIDTPTHWMLLPEPPKEI